MQRCECGTHQRLFQDPERKRGKRVTLKLSNSETHAKVGQRSHGSRAPSQGGFLREREREKPEESMFRDTKKYVTRIT